MSLAEHIKNNALLGIKKITLPAGASRRPKLAVHGASICARSNQIISGTIQLVPTGHIEKLQALRGCPFDIVALDGQGGTTAAAGKVRFAANVAAYGPDLVIIGADLAGNQINGGATADVTYADMMDIVAQCRAIPAIPVIATIPPNVKLYSTLAVDAVNGDANGAEDASDTLNKATFSYNRMIEDFARNNNDVILHHWGRRNVDYSRTDGQYVQLGAVGPAATTWSHDKTHPHPKYAWDLALDLDAILGTSKLESTLPFSPGNADDTKWVLNPCLVGTTGTANQGATGSIATSCTLSGGNPTVGSCVGAKTARTDGLAGGLWQEVTITGSDKSATFTFTGVGSSALPVGYDIANDAVFGAVEIVMLSTPVNLRGIKVSINYSQSGAKSLGGASTNEGTTFADIADAGPYIPLNRTLTFPTAINKLAGMTSITSITVEATKSSTGNLTAHFYIGRPVVKKNPYGVPFVAETPATP